MSRIRLGTRASALARWQAHWVATQLGAAGWEVELIPMTTRGDTLGREPIAHIGSPGIFTKELQRALLTRQIDVAVHSLKDLPTEAVDGLVLAAVSRREEPADVLISRHGQPLAELPPASAIGTDSLRRRAQLLHVRPGLQMRDIRGNVDTRIEKVEAGQYDALVLAQAGLKRLGLEAKITQVFGFDLVLPAVGQGALGIETRMDDDATRAAVAALDHLPSHQAVLAERALLATLCGGCLAPVGALAEWQADGSLRLDAVVLSADGRQRLARSAVASTVDPQALGVEVAQGLIAAGAAALIQQARE